MLTVTMTFDDRSQKILEDRSEVDKVPVQTADGKVWKPRLSVADMVKSAVVNAYGLQNNSVTDEAQRLEAQIADLTAQLQEKKMGGVSVEVKAGA